MKLDFHKAFDSVAWGFLDWVLKQMAFPDKWREWIRVCVMSASASILINGSPTTPIKMQRGLRQGDPLSPFLFDIVAEPLNLLIKKAISMNLWEGLEVCKRGVKISHLQYADDTILFCPPDMDCLLNIKSTLILFELASGLRVNFHKSSLIDINIDKSWLDLAAQKLLCKIGEVPFTYLRLPIGGKTNSIAAWDPVIDRMHKKLASWKGNLLSIGGRVVLIKASLSNLPLYYMFLFPTPISVINKFVKIQRAFLWSGSMGKKSLSPIAWHSVQLTKEEGGLGIGNPLQKNLALLFKWWWRFLCEPQALWRQVIHDKYRLNNLHCPTDLLSPKSGGPWKHICSTLLGNALTAHMISSCIRRKVGNGEDTLFWQDIWIGDKPLKNMFPRIFRLSPNQLGTISAMGFWDGAEWKWTIGWKRPLRPQDTREEQELLKLLQQVSLSPLDNDLLIWAPCKNGNFSVNSVVMELSKQNSQRTNKSFKGLWKGLVPFRIEIFLWLAIQEKLNTKAKLGRLGIIPVAESVCTFCGLWPESPSHLLLHCQFSWALWAWWLQIWELKWVPPSSLYEAFFQWQFPSHNPFFKKIWCAIFFIIPWTLWKERNTRCFENKANNQAHLQNLVLLRLSWWIKGWNDAFSYTSDDVIRNPMCLKWAKIKSLDRRISRDSSNKDANWLPPPDNFMKWNVDASLQPLSQKSAIGGVLRGSDGKFKCLFSCPIPLMEINHAEVFAIHRAIRILLASDYLNSSGVIIESDSANAVKWCNGETPAPWSLNFIINFIRRSMLSSPGISITYKNRESNIVADSLARQGLLRLDDFVAWF